MFVALFGSQWKAMMVIMRSLIATLLVFLACAAVPARADFDAGMRAYEAEDYVTAFREWQPLAEAGDARAQYWVGTMYRFGKGVGRDYGHAIRLLGKAASQTANGDTQRRAVYGLGYMANNGHGMEKDEDKAECLYRVAAENGYANAQYALSLMLRKRWSINFEELDWLERAAAQGDDYALSRLGRINVSNPWWGYVFGPPDYVEGYMFLVLAAERGMVEAEEILAEVRSSRDQTKLSALARAETLAGDWRAVPEEPPAVPFRVPEGCWP